MNKIAFLIERMKRQIENISTNQTILGDGINIRVEFCKPALKSYSSTTSRTDLIEDISS